jgi:hypothetical protein
MKQSYANIAWALKSRIGCNDDYLSKTVVLFKPRAISVQGKGALGSGAHLTE